LVQFAGHEERSLVRWCDISCFGNGNDIKTGGEIAKSSWIIWKKATKENYLSAELLPLDHYSELPCPNLHPEYDVSHSNSGPEHDLDFWVICGCKNALHYRPLRTELSTESLDYECLPKLPERIKMYANWKKEERPFNTDEAQMRFDASNAAKKR
jgi:hypothetical protein